MFSGRVVAGGSFGGSGYWKAGAVEARQGRHTSASRHGGGLSGAWGVERCRDRPPGTAG